MTQQDGITNPDRRKKLVVGMNDKFTITEHEYHPGAPQGAPFSCTFLSLCRKLLAKYTVQKKPINPDSSDRRVKVRGAPCPNGIPSGRDLRVTFKSYELSKFICIQ